MNVNVNVSDWQVEMHRLLEVIERESTLSLRKMDRTFNEEFRQHFLKMSTLRLDLSFNKILFERLDESQTHAQTSSSSTASASNNDNGIANNWNNLCLPTNNVGPPNTSVKQKVMELKVESCIDATIEITDSDDDVTVVEYSGRRREVNDGIDCERESSAAQHITETNDIAQCGNVQDGIDFNVGNYVEIKQKCELKSESESEDEMMDLPLEVFDPNKVNDSTGEKSHAATHAESMGDQNQPSTSSSAQKQAKQNDGNRYKCKHCAYTSQNKWHFQSHQLIHEGLKPFKCDNCDYATRLKRDLSRHQRTHDCQKLLGISQDPNGGLYKCTHCDQRFTQWYGLKKHLTQTHKNNQRLFNCKRCMRRFTRKSEKETHELRCEKRVYECHLCTYVASDVTHMQVHMRTHTGAKPFECVVCNKSYQQKNNLNRHLNTVHSRINK